MVSEGRKKRNLRKLAQQLGVRNVKNLHVDNYTEELKDLVAHLQEENLEIQG